MVNCTENLASRLFATGVFALAIPERLHTSLSHAVRAAAGDCTFESESELAELERLARAVKIDAVSGAELNARSRTIPAVTADRRLRLETNQEEKRCAPAQLGQGLQVHRTVRERRTWSVRHSLRYATSRHRHQVRMADPGRQASG